MKLLLSRFASDVHGFPLLIVDTETQKYQWFNFGGNFDHTVRNSTFGLAYSGQWLCAAMQTDQGDALLLSNILDDSQLRLHFLKDKLLMHSLISVYPGQLYASCEFSNTLHSISFSEITGNLLETSVHFSPILPDRFKLTEVCCHDTKWFASIYCGNDSGMILELNTMRVVFSDVNIPRSIFFNRDMRLCFCEYLNENLHCGDIVFPLRSNPMCAMEDVFQSGYWVAIKKKNKNSLILLDYFGKMREQMELPSGEYFSIVDARGWLNEAL